MASYGERIRRAREGRCLTQEDLARAIRELDPMAGVDRVAVRRWEQERTFPSARYQRLLAKALGTSPVDLGLVDGESLAETDYQDSLDPMNLRDPLSRRALLGAAITVGIAQIATAQLPPLLAPSSGRVGTAGAEGYAAMVRSLMSYYWTSPDAASVHNQATLLADQGCSLVHRVSGADRTGVAAAAAAAALLAGRTAFFDLDLPRRGASMYGAALAMAGEAGDRSLEAAVHAHAAFVPGFGGDFAAAEAELEIATLQANKAGPALRSWLHCVRAEISARNGIVDKASEQIRRAEDVLGRSGSTHDWLDWFDAARLDGFAGYVHMMAGRNEKAVATFERSLLALAPNAVKQQAVVHLDLATAYASLAPERAVEHATAAIEVLSRDFYAAAGSRIPVVQQALAGTAYHAIVEERARALLAA